MNKRHCGIFCAGLIFILAMGFGISLLAEEGVKRSVSVSSYDLKSPAVSSAVPSAEPAAKETAAGGMDAIMDSLNKALEENQKMRRDVNNAQENIRKIVLENNMLKATVIDLKQNQYQMRDEEKLKREDAEAKIGDLVRKVESLEEDNIYLIRENEEISKQRSQQKSETERVKNAMMSVVPQDEKPAYAALVDNLSESVPVEEGVPGETSPEVAKKVKEELGALYYSLGNMLFAQEDFKGAVAKYRKALEMNPNDAWTYYNLGVIFDFYLNDDPKAMSFYRKYLELAPEEVDSNKVRERLADMNLMKEVIPPQPLTPEFEAHYKKYQ